MAKIQEEVIVVTVSKLLKNEGPTSNIVTDEQLEALASVVEEILGNGIVVEVNKA